MRNFQDEMLLQCGYISGAIQDLVQYILAVMVVVIGVGLSVWGIPKGVRALKNAFGAGSR